VELAGAQHAAELVPGLRRGPLADQRIEHALLGGELGLGRHALAQALAGHAEGDLHEIAHNLLDIAADIADLGELGRLDLQERRLGEAREAPRDLGLADPRRADHQDVLGLHLLAQAFRQLLAAPAVAERNGDGALGFALADDVAAQLGDDLARAEAPALLRLLGYAVVHKDSIV